MDVDEEQAHYQPARDACASTGEAISNWKYLADGEATESQLATFKAGGKLPRKDVCLAEALTLKWAEVSMPRLTDWFMEEGKKHRQYYSHGDVVVPIQAYPLADRRQRRRSWA